MASAVRQLQLACLSPLPRHVEAPPYSSEPSSNVSTSEMLSLAPQVSWLLLEASTAICLYSGVIS